MTIIRMPKEIHLQKTTMRPHIVSDQPVNASFPSAKLQYLPCAVRTDLVERAVNHQA